MKNEEQIGYMIKELSRLIDRSIYQKSMLNTQGDSATAMHGWMIGYLYHRKDQDVFQRDMEADFHMAKSSVTAALQGLEKGGYIKRVPVERDGRLKKIVLTQEGERFHCSVEKGVREMESHLTDQLNPEELTQIFFLLNQIKRNLEEQIRIDKDRLNERKEGKR
ncbi:MAG: MarR family transcriptional regulator [Lachnospiraceae bacterium]|nr:MarR family transcriptional regulator [Lachnospiraceae bacterium]